MMRRLIFSKKIFISMVFLAGFSANAQEVTEKVTSGKSMLRGVATPEFNKPLYFDQVNQGVVLPPMEIEYEVISGDRGGLKFGSAFISEGTFSVQMLSQNQLNSIQQASLSDLKPNGNVFILSWPDRFLAPQVIEAISSGGRVLWSQSISTKEVESWDQFSKKENLRVQSPFQNSRLGFINWQPPESFAKAPEFFRFCLSSQVDSNKTRLCTGHYGFQKTESGLTLRRRASEAITARVVIDNAPVPAKGSVPFKGEEARVFYAELPSGILIEVLARSPVFELMDIIETPKESFLRIVGEGVLPLQRTHLLNKEEYSSLTKFVGFEDTIGDHRVIWAAALNQKNPQMYFPGLAGAVFKQRFELSQIPSYRSRVYLSTRAPSATYSSEISLDGRKSVASRIESTENSVEIEKPEDQEFTWNFKSAEKSKINRSYLTVQADGQNYRSYYEIYRGRSTELSTRLSTVQSTETIFMGEVSLNHWFENFFGWDNYYIGRHRWGVSGKYFQSFNDIYLSQGTERIKLSASTVDLKYRLAPGLWSRDETLGLLGSYQDVKFGASEAPMAGVGVFWARSMPRSLDNLFNLAPFMNYPKWVNVEFIFYTTPLKSDIQLNASMSLNFHGKVMWTESFFGEAGFGVKRYAFKDLTLNQLAELNTFYGTAGIGISF